MSLYCIANMTYTSSRLSFTLFTFILFQVDEWFLKNLSFSYSKPLMPIEIGVFVFKSLELFNFSNIDYVSLYIEYWSIVQFGWNLFVCLFVCCCNSLFDALVLYWNTFLFWNRGETTRFLRSFSFRWCRSVSFRFRLFVGLIYRLLELIYRILGP